MSHRCIIMMLLIFSVAAVSMRACVGDGGPFRTPARATKLDICAAVGRKRTIDGSRGDAERSRGQASRAEEHWICFLLRSDGTKWEWHVEDRREPIGAGD